MSDAAPSAVNATLVIRCPTCKNLLPEPPGYSLFHCGGCGALLTANRRHLMSGKEMVGAVDGGEKDGSIGASNSDVRIKLNDIGSASSVRESKDTVAIEGIVKVFPTKQLPGFNEIGNDGHFESNGNVEVDGNRMSHFEGEEKMHESRNDDVMVTPLSCFEEGPSNYIYDYDPMSHVDEGMRNTYLQGSKRVKHLEQDRLEILRKLDELNNQLRQSGSLSRTTKEKGIVGQDMAHNERYGIADAWMANDCLDPDMRKASKQTFLDNKKLCRPPCANYHDSYPYTSRPGQYMQSSYHRPRLQDDTLRYGMSFESQMPRRPVPSVYSQYAAYPPNFPVYYPGQYVDADPDTFKPYQHNASFHHPSCSCFQCYNVHHNTMPTAPCSNFPGDTFTYTDMPSNNLAYHHDYDSRVTKRPYSFHDTRTSAIGADDFNSRVGNCDNYRIRRVVPSKVGRQCHPLLGGAPFATCHNCFEVLQLPINLFKLKDQQNKLRCGACSTILNYFFQENKLLISDHCELKSESNSSEILDEGILKSVGPGNQSDDKFNSDDFDILSNDFKLFNVKHDMRDTFCNLKGNETQDTHAISTSSASPSNTEEECSQLNRKVQRNRRKSIAPPAGSPLQEHLDYSSSNHMINQDEKGSLSRESDNEKIIHKPAVIIDQNSLKEESMPTEMEVSFNGYSNSGISQDSGNGSKEEQHREINIKDGLAGIIKKSFKEIIKLDQSNEGEKTCVTINGHPMSDRAIKKASSRAGRVQPGNYWYDVRAGFWGVMGGPCLGIILPFIEEFNYPLSEDCSGGTTGVFVNGRELHEKDLQLLSGRGLPTTRDRSYIIEISGRVLDADSGKELDSLGRLARTVEKAKHGFGMKVPKQIVVNKIEQ